MSSGNQRGLFNPAPSIRITEMFNQAPPCAPEGEMALLGAMLIDPSCVDEVAGVIQRADRFFTPGHAALYQAILDCKDNGSQAGLISLVELLRERGQYDAVGGIPYIEQLLQQTPGPASALHFARLIVDKASVRGLIDVAGKILYSAYHTGVSVPGASRQLLDDAEQMIFDLNKGVTLEEVKTMEELMADEILRLEARDEQRSLGLATGFTDLDNLLGGLVAGEMIVVAARPSVGKTALMMNLVEQVARGGVAPGHLPVPKKDWKPVGVFSLEMSKTAIAQRLISAAAGVTMHQLRGAAPMSATEMDRAAKAMGELSELPTYFDDTPGLTINMLRGRARRLAANYGIKAIFIDYLQLMTAPDSRGENRQVEVAAISRGVKAMARELNVPVVCLCQLNRGSEDRRDNRPRMSDLRESGAIEQDADVIILIHREAAAHVGDEDWARENPHKVNATELIIAKQRNGPVGSVPLFWKPSITRFVNKDDAPAAPVVVPANLGVPV